jgi:hypothetical protein
MTYTSEQLIAAAVATAKDEISTHIRLGVVPPTVKRFGELHDYMDANLYGGGAFLFSLCGGDCDILNAVQNAVDAWLWNGRPEAQAA